MKIYTFTDHQSLCHILTQPKLCPVHHDWLANILTYDFKIQWKPGKWNTIANTLSCCQFSKDISIQVNTVNGHTVSICQYNGPLMALEEQGINLIELTITGTILQDIKDMTPDDREFKDISQYLINPDDPETYNCDPKLTPPHLRTQLTRYKLLNILLYYIDQTLCTSNPQNLNNRKGSLLWPCHS
ncbi:UNVERIFIED_CONTAM: hypothetical protein HDU68_001068 [Siphonaria sp. JEL0065]|nr:hypothetical protein HDU68_001068 [Siphonaria sp. JEL0065]